MRQHGIIGNLQFRRAVEFRVVRLDRMKIQRIFFSKIDRETPEIRRRPSDPIRKRTILPFSLPPRRARNALFERFAS